MDAIGNAIKARREATRRLKDALSCHSNRNDLGGLEYAYSPSTCAVGMRWSEDAPFAVFNIYYPMYGRSEMVRDWVSVGAIESLAVQA